MTAAPGLIGRLFGRRPVDRKITEDKLAVATQRQLIWWRFKKHKLAVISMFVVALFYLVVAFADFLAYADPEASDSRRGYIPPQSITWFDSDGSFRPYVHGLKGVRDLKTFKLVYRVDESRKVYVRFFAEGYPYHLFGFIPANRHLLGYDTSVPENGLFLLGTDVQGRDLWSRLMVATRVSLLIGLAGVTISLFLGVLFGGISGLYGGAVDTAIQRLIELVRSIPTIPLWMGLAAALPNTWSSAQVYFAITIIISLIGWTDLARVVRGRFLSLREEDFVVAAELMGASRLRIIFRHMLPSFTSSHHCSGQPRSSRHDHLRNVAEFPWARPPSARDQLGHPAAGRAERSNPGDRAMAATVRDPGHHRHSRL